MPTLVASHRAESMVDEAGSRLPKERPQASKMFRLSEPRQTGRVRSRGFRSTRADSPPCAISWADSPHRVYVYHAPPLI